MLEFARYAGEGKRHTMVAVDTRQPLSVFELTDGERLMLGAPPEGTNSCGLSVGPRTYVLLESYRQVMEAIKRHRARGGA